jgi:hypothetical protein
MKGIYNKFWPVEDVAILKFFFPDHTNSFIADFLGKNEAAIQQKAFKLGLRKAEGFIRECGLKGAFKPGNQPFNKGIPQKEWLSEAGLEKSKTGRFKKGEQHVDYGKGRGKVSVYKNEVWINTGYKKRELFSRYQYRKFIGEIPEGHIVTFKDGNPLNCCPLNLRLISRAENMLRNTPVFELRDSAVANYMAMSSRKMNKELRDEFLKHPDLLELKRQQLLLNRAIYEQTTN